MARYDYTCPECDLTFEIERSINDRSAVSCPTCGVTARKVFSPSAVVFKGSGFHNTDYRPRQKSDEGPAANKPTPKPACPAASDGAGCAACAGE